jgi:hypothetical protein
VTGPTEPTPSGPPLVSADGYWRWDGTRWVPTYAYPSYRVGGPFSNAGEGMALASLIVSVMACGIGSIPAVILGHLSRRDARRAGQDPSPMATIGLVFGYLGVAAIAVFVAVVTAGIASEAFVEEEQFFSGDVATALHSAGDAEESWYSEHHSYSRSLSALVPYGYREVPGVDIAVVSASETEFCLRANDGGPTMWLSSDDSSTLTLVPCR